MKKTFIKLFHCLQFNFKTLLYFEVLYRLLGIFIIYPLARILFFLSINITGFSYINNKVLIDYITNPFTILILIILLFVLSFYIIIEIVYLSILFDYSYHQIKLDLKTYLIIGIKRVFNIIKKYHIYAIYPAFLLFIIVELLQIVGITATITLPQYILSEAFNVALYRFILIGFAFIIIYLFFESILTLQIYNIDNISIKNTFNRNRQLLKSNRFKMIKEFILLNTGLNMLLYGIYIVVIGLIAGVIFIVRGQELILSFLLTIIHVVYLIIGFVATIFLIPINYGLVSIWYYQAKKKKKQLINPPKMYLIHKPLNFKWIKRVIIITFIVVFSLNITNIYTLVEQTKQPIELFKYSEVIAHRGASTDAPENTISAIELAIEQGANAIEIDIRETSDLVPVLMHDSRLKRTTSINDNTRVNDVTYKYLKTLDAGSWFAPLYQGEKVPSLEEVLIKVKGRCQIFIELKENSSSLNQNVVNLIETYHAVHNVKVMSFDELQLKTIKNLNPNIETIYLATNIYGNRNKLLNRYYIDNLSLELSFLLDNPDFLEDIHQSSKKIYVWTVNKKSDLQEAVDIDVDGIITDEPILAREIVYSKNKSSLIQELLKDIFAR